MRARSLLAACGLVFLVSTPSLACNGDKVLFQEDFTVADATWGEMNQNFEIKDGKAVLRPSVQRVMWRYSGGFLFEDADICATVTLLETADPTSTWAGIGFWLSDSQNGYFLNIASNGNFQVRRMTNNNWVANPVGWTKSDALKQGPNQPNRLRLTLKGQSVSIELNGKPVARFRAQSPGQPSMIALTASSGDRQDQWTIEDLKVTNVK